MLRSCYRCFGRLGIGGGGGDGLLWHLDLKPHASGEFSIAVVQANTALEDQGQVLTSPLGTYVGVYDGHGGPEASRFVNSHLFPHLHSNHLRGIAFGDGGRRQNRGFLTFRARFSAGLALEQGGVSEDVIKRAFRETEEEFLHLAKRSWTSRPQIAAVGSCCLVGMITGDLLYVANLGDSRAVLGRRDAGGVVAERLSRDHNVAVEEVRRELKDLHPDDSHIVVYSRGVWRIKGIIQVSRSIGDMYLKKPEFSRDPIFQQFVCPVPIKRAVMSSEPSIEIRKLKPQDLFLIFASDGLWEQLSDEAAVDIVINNPRAGIAKRLVKTALTEAAKKREMRYEDIKHIEKGIRRHFHDDITVIVIFLDHHHHPGGSLRSRNVNVDSTNAPVDIFSFNTNEAMEEMQPIIT